MPAAKELLGNLTEADRTAQFHKAKAALFSEELPSQDGELRTRCSIWSESLGKAGPPFSRARSPGIPEGRFLSQGVGPGQVTDNGFKLVFPAIPGIKPFEARRELRVTETCAVEEVP